jgi:hypothetical protein
MADMLWEPKQASRSHGELPCVKPEKLIYSRIVLVLKLDIDDIIHFHNFFLIYLL